MILHENRSPVGWDLRWHPGCLPGHSDQLLEDQACDSIRLALNCGICVYGLAYPRDDDKAGAASAAGQRIQKAMRADPADKRIVIIQKELDSEILKGIESDRD